MTREDIIRMAHEAGLHLATDVNWMPIIDLSYAEKFANLVAAAEREACAMEAEYEAARWAYAPEAREPCEEVAKAIRARREQ